MIKKVLVLFIKMAIGASLVWFIVWKAGPDWEQSKQIIWDLFQSEYYFFLAGLFCFAFVVLLGTFRWQLLLKAHQVNLSFSEMLKLFFIGHFFSQFMPGGLAGGDVIKSFYISTHTDDRKHEAVTTIVIDRIVGTFGLFGALIIGVLANLGSISESRNIWFVLGFFILAGLVMVLFFSKGLLKKIPGMPKLIDKIPYRNIVTRVYNAFHYYKDHKLVLTLTLLFSIIIHVILTAMVFFVAHGLGLETPFKMCLIIVPLVNFIGSVPVSPLGTVGTLDAAYIHFFENEAEGNAGLPVALALVIRLIYTLWGVVGLFVWLFMRSQMSSDGTIDSKNSKSKELIHSEVKND